MESPANTPARPAADEDWTGQTLGDFRIWRLLGRGGMGQVYLAEQVSLKRQVALKMLRPELAANKTALARFRAEAEAVARLSHANIVQVHAIGEQDGVHYMALEYVKGRNLREYLQRKGPPDVAVCLSLMRQVASALQRAHEAGFVHRDIKPENILITRKAQAKVTDFGLTRCFGESSGPANLTQTGVAMGTPMYMSPEQVQGKPVDQRTDIYSFGITCFTLFTGSPPFRGASSFDIALQHVQNDPPSLAKLRPDLPPMVCAMIHQMMAKDPDQRYPSFKEVLADLSRLRGAMAKGTRLPTATARKPAHEPRPARSWGRPALVAAMLAAVFLGGVAMRLIRNRFTAPASAASAPAPERTTPVVSSEERFLLEAAQQYRDPNTADARELKRGLEFQVDLAAYYFKHRRLGEAQQLFRDLREKRLRPMPPVPAGAKELEHPYRALGRLGEALVAAQRDQPEALDALANLLSVQPRPARLPTFQVAGIPALFDYPELRRLIVDALNRLAMVWNVERFEKYPHLDQLRRPPGRGRPPAPSKG